LALKLWDRKTYFLKNKAEKLLKTNGKATRVAKNKPKNKAEKLLKTRSCGKTKLKTKRSILLITNEGEKTNRKQTGAWPGARRLLRTGGSS
jgi:hypothetical protein